jgi:tripartite-type tricarboxylate transporter receptor subunit TctC
MRTGLSVTSRKRLTWLPDVPTVQEAGFSDFKTNGLSAFVGAGRAAGCQG